MNYLQRQEPARALPASVLAGARSVVAVALNYHLPEAPLFSDDPRTPRGIVARYARYDDYHTLMWERLNALLAAIAKQFTGVTGKAFCDTGPVTERDLAMRAGIGWIGKHTNLIERRMGNFFFLGAILVDLALDVDPPESTHCGTCSRCMPACPTGAIIAPYQLDARRCVSYLTIELKGSIPVELRPLIGNRIYGCDDCLAVCPWNRFAKAASDPGLRARTDVDAPELIPLLSLDDDRFRDRFRNSPIRRTKRRGFLRNVCVALGNIADAAALPALARVAESDGEPLVREHAAWAIERIEGAQRKRT